MSSITVRLGGKSEVLPIESGANLLALLRSAGYSVAAACGGRGKCGKCRVRVNGVPRLACRVMPCDGDEIILNETTGGRILTETPEIHIPAKHPGGCAAAVDLGTTTIAVRVYDLDTGESCTCTAWNRQSAYGGDVISRIQYTSEHPNGLDELSTIVRREVEEMITSALAQLGRDAKDLCRIVLCGNTTMQHIFAHLPVDGIAKAPFIPETLFRDDVGDTLLGVPVIYAPCVAGYIGGDIVCGIMSADLRHMSGCNLLLDIGTNGEMVLSRDGRLYSCSVASGPAFEGGGISCGMAAVDGAISHVRYSGGFLYDVIGAVKPRGLCGSGIIDIVALLCEKSCIDGGGRLLPPQDVPPAMRRYITADENGNGVFNLTENISITAQDVRNLQLAKGAVAAGIRVLTSQCGIAERELDGVYLAGGLGSYVDIGNAIKIGMIPDIPQARLHSIGNTALAGAAQLAVGQCELSSARDIAVHCGYTELSGRADFAAAFANSLAF